MKPTNLEHSKRGIMKRFFALLALVLCLSFTFIQSSALADCEIVSFNPEDYDSYPKQVGFVDGDQVFSFNPEDYDSYPKQVGFVQGDIDNAAKGAAELLLFK